MKGSSRLHLKVCGTAVVIRALGDDVLRAAHRGGRIHGRTWRTTSRSPSMRITPVVTRPRREVVPTSSAAVLAWSGSACRSSTTSWSRGRPEFRPGSRRDNARRAGPRDRVAVLATMPSARWGGRRRRIRPGHLSSTCLQSIAMSRDSSPAHPRRAFAGALLEHEPRTKKIRPIW